MRRKSNFKTVLAKKHRTNTFIDLRFTYDMEPLKLLYFEMQKQDVDLLHLLREKFQAMVNEENLKYQEFLKADRVDEYVAFADTATNIVPRRHFTQDFTDEKLKIFKLFQLLHKKMGGRPVNAKLVWLERKRIGFKDSDLPIFEDALYQLIQETRLEEIVTEMSNGKTTSKFIPSIVLKRTQFTAMDNPFHKSDLAHSKRAEQNVKEGRNVVVTQYKKRTEDAEET